MTVTAVETIAAAWITIFALALFLVSFISYRRISSPRLLVIAFAFLVFFIKGLLMSLDTLANWNTVGGYMPLLDITILFLLASAVLIKRGGGDA